MDPHYKRLSYVRYADDWIIGIRGSKKDSFAILESCRSFLLDNLKLELSVDKTLISHFIKEKVLFLGV